MVNNKLKYFNAIILLILLISSISCKPNQSIPDYEFIESTTEVNEIDNLVLITEVTETPQIYPQPTIQFYKRQDLGISVGNVISYFEKIGMDFEIIERNDSNEVSYIGSYQDAYFLYLNAVNNVAKSARMDIWLDFTKFDENAPGLGDLPIALFGQDLYYQTISPWLMGLPDFNDTLCLDELVFQYTNFNNTRVEENRLSLWIFTEADCSWIDGCCPIKH